MSQFSICTTDLLKNEFCIPGTSHYLWVLPAPLRWHTLQFWNNCVHLWHFFLQMASIKSTLKAVFERLALGQAGWVHPVQIIGCWGNHFMWRLYKQVVMNLSVELESLSSRCWKYTMSASRHCCILFLFYDVIWFAVLLTLSTEFISMFSFMI